MKYIKKLITYIQLNYKKYLPFILLFIYFLLLHKNIPFIGDDLAKKEKIINLAFYNRYFTWSTRLIADTLAVIFSKMPYIIFKVLDSFVYTFIAYLFSKFFNDKKEIKLDCFICLLVAIFPFSTMGTAGWVATSTGYNWPVLASLIAFLPVKNVINNKEISKWHLLYVIPCILYATDPQALGMLIFGFSTILLIYYWIKNKSIKKVNWFIIFLFIISLIKIIYTLTSPSVAYRTLAETERFFPVYGELNIFQKIYIGYLYTFRMLIIYPEFLIIFSVMINIITHINQKKLINKILSDILLFIVLSLTLFRNYIAGMSEGFKNFTESIFEDIVSLNIDYNLLLLIVITFIILASLYLIIINRKNRFIICTIFLAGLFSQLIMSFAPTIYASSYRTACFMYFCLIIVNIYQFKEIILSKKVLGALYLLLIIPVANQLIKLW